MSDSVIVGLSGGVDSSYSAWLLQQQGYKVSAVFMRNWDDDGGEYCTAQEDFIDACRVADMLKIDLQDVNFTHEYKKEVFQRSLDLLNRGMTPNPDVWCNSYIKFGIFLDYALAKADKIATGHYARVKTKEDGSKALFRAIDSTKDQSYFLHQLNQKQLSNCIFPLGDLTKQQVRESAQKIGLPNFDKSDSTGICFIGERPFASFIKEYVECIEGDIVDDKNKVVGHHEGLPLYTIGQRKGLGIGGSKNTSGEAWYVAGKNLETNQLLVVQGANHELLYTKAVEIEDTHWINSSYPHQLRMKNHTKNRKYDESLANYLACDKISATIRYRQKPQQCSVFFLGVSCTALRISFFHKQKAATEGQFAVVYSEQECLGGGVLSLGGRVR